MFEIIKEDSKFIFSRELFLAKQLELRRIFSGNMTSLIIMNIEISARYMNVLFNICYSNGSLIIKREYFGRDSLVY